MATINYVTTSEIGLYNCCNHSIPDTRLISLDFDDVLTTGVDKREFGAGQKELIQFFITLSSQKIESAANSE